MREILKLKDVCQISGGYAFKSTQYKSEGTALIRIGDISEKIVEISDGSVYIDDDISKYDKFIIKKGDILVALSGATTGKFGIYNYDELALLNQRVAKISPNELVYNSYLFYYMNKLKDIIYSKALGCAQPNISPTEISELEIYVPNLETQKKIAEVLDKAQELIDKRKEQIEALDELVKSRFIEMFGDPVLEEKYIKYSIDDIKANEKFSIVDGPFGASLKNGDYVEDGIPIIRINNIQPCNYYDGEYKYISNEKYEELIRSKVEKNDILMARVGNTIGKSCIFDKDFKALLSTTGVCKIKCKVEIANNVFIMRQLNMPTFREYIWRNIKGSGQPCLNLTTIKGLKVILPPIELQNQFADFVKQVDKLKSQMENSLKELEDNFNSLMQKAFKGELF